MRLSGQVVLVTGGSGELGSAICCALAREGAKVAIHYHHDAANAERLASEINAQGGEAMTVCADVTDAAAVKGMVQAVLARWERVDTLVNNAGVNADRLLIMMREEDWDRVLDTNLKGAFLCARAVAKPMLKRRAGKIVNIASASGILGQTGQANYSASKAGLIGLSRALARELAAYGITVNVVAPGFIDSKMVRGMPPQVLENTLHTIPLKRLGKPEEVAEAVVFLTSPAAAYLTGHVLAVDGGVAM